MQNPFAKKNRVASAGSMLSDIISSKEPSHQRENINSSNKNDLNIVTILPSNNNSNLTKKQIQINETLNPAGSWQKQMTLQFKDKIILLKLKNQFSFISPIQIESLNLNNLSENYIVGGRKKSMEFNNKNLLRCLASNKQILHLVNKHHSLQSSIIDKLCNGLDFYQYNVQRNKFYQIILQNNQDVQIIKNISKIYKIDLGIAYYTFVNTALSCNIVKQIPKNFKQYVMSNPNHQKVIMSEIQGFLLFDKLNLVQIFNLLLINKRPSQQKLIRPSQQLKAMRSLINISNLSMSVRQVELIDNILALLNKYCVKLSSNGIQQLLQNNFNNFISEIKLPKLKNKLFDLILNLQLNLGIEGINHPFSQIISYFLSSKNINFAIFFKEVYQFQDLHHDILLNLIENKLKQLIIYVYKLKQSSLSYKVTQEILFISQVCIKVIISKQQLKKILHQWVNCLIVNSKFNAIYFLIRNKNFQQFQPLSIQIIKNLSSMSTQTFNKLSSQSDQFIKQILLNIPKFQFMNFNELVFNLLQKLIQVNLQGSLQILDRRLDPAFCFSYKQSYSIIKVIGKFIPKLINHSTKLLTLIKLVLSQINKQTAINSLQQFSSYLLNYKFTNDKVHQFIALFLQYSMVKQIIQWNLKLKPQHKYDQTNLQISNMNQLISLFLQSDKTNNNQSLRSMLIKYIKPIKFDKLLSQNQQVDENRFILMLNVLKFNENFPQLQFQQYNKTFKNFGQQFYNKILKSKNVSPMLRGQIFMKLKAKNELFCSSYQQTFLNSLLEQKSINIINFVYFCLRNNQQSFYYLLNHKILQIINNQIMFPNFYKLANVKSMLEVTYYLISKKENQINLVNKKLAKKCFKVFLDRLFQSNIGVKQIKDEVQFINQILLQSFDEIQLKIHLKYLDKSYDFQLTKESQSTNNLIYYIIKITIQWQDKFIKSNTSIKSYLVIFLNYFILLIKNIKINNVIAQLSYRVLQYIEGYNCNQTVQFCQKQLLCLSKLISSKLTTNKQLKPCNIILHKILKGQYEFLKQMNISSQQSLMWISHLIVFSQQHFNLVINNFYALLNNHSHNKLFTLGWIYLKFKHFLDSNNYQIANMSYYPSYINHISEFIWSLHIHHLIITKVKKSLSTSSKLLTTIGNILGRLEYFWKIIKGNEVSDRERYLFCIQVISFINLLMARRFIYIWQINSNEHKLLIEFVGRILVFTQQLLSHQITPNSTLQKMMVHKHEIEQYEKTIFSDYVPSHINCLKYIEIRLKVLLMKQIVNLHILSLGIVWQCSTYQIQNFIHLINFLIFHFLKNNSNKEIQNTKNITQTNQLNKLIIEQQSIMEQIINIVNNMNRLEKSQHKESIYKLGLLIKQH